MDDQLSLAELTSWNALRKGLAVAHVRPDRVVLACDTLVAFEGRIIGKPADLEEAGRILHRLSGRQHEVCSSVFVAHLAKKKTILFHELSRVQFRCLDDDAIARYLAKINPLDKAGAYAAQGEGAEIIRAIEGSFSNVVGLPMETTVPILARFGVRPRPGA